MVLVEGAQTGIQRAPLPRAVFEMVLQTGASCTQQVPGSGSGRGLKRTLGTGVQAAPGWGLCRGLGIWFQLLQVQNLAQYTVGDIIRF